MVTLKEIAGRCGVSVATVSKALNGAADVSRATAQRIRHTARQMGYYPNAAARALKTNRSHNIGVLFEDETRSGLTHEYFSHVLEALKNGLEERGYDVTFISRNIGVAQTRYLDHCRYRNYDGVAIANVDFEDPAVAELIGGGIPVVTIDYVFPNHSAVLSDNVRGMLELVGHVHAMGHRRIAFIHGEDTAVTRARLQGFSQALKELGLELPEGYLCPARYHDTKCSAQATRSLLALAQPPTCILYPDDISILGGMAEIENQGLRVPEDISIAGYDGIAMSQLLRPRITTLYQDSERLGSETARLLVEAIEAPGAYAPHTLTVPGRLLPGDTVGAV